MRTRFSCKENRRNFTFEEFNSKWKEMNNQGYTLFDLETYADKGKRKRACIWEKSNRVGRQITPNDYCRFMASHDLSLIHI